MKYLYLTIIMLFIQLTLNAKVTGVETNILLPKGKGFGHKLSGEVYFATQMIKRKKYAEALTELDKIKTKYHKLMKSNKKYLCFQSEDEYKKYLEISNDKTVVWLDWGYQQCFQLEAFIKAGLGQYQEAISSLSTVTAIAPASATAFTEKGYALIRMKKFKEALIAYKKALKLTEQYKKTKTEKAVVLRGIGFIYIELGKLEQAEQIFHISLQLEPNNKKALHELSYIKKLKKNK